MPVAVKPVFVSINCFLLLLLLLILIRINLQFFLLIIWLNAMFFVQVLDTFLSIRIKQVEKPEDKEKSQKLTKEDKMKKFSKRERKVSQIYRHFLAFQQSIVSNRCFKNVHFVITWLVALVINNKWLNMWKEMVECIKLCGVGFQRHKAMEHLEKELREAAAEEDVKHKLKVVSVICSLLCLVWQFYCVIAAVIIVMSI